MANLKEVLTQSGLKSDLRLVQALDDSFSEVEIDMKSVLTVNTANSGDDESSPLIGILIGDPSELEGVRDFLVDRGYLPRHVEIFSLSSVIYPLGK